MLFIKKKYFAKNAKKCLLLIIYASCFLGIMPYEISVSNYLTSLYDQLRKKFYNRWRELLAKSIVKNKTTSPNWNHLCRPVFSLWVRKTPWRRKWQPTLAWKIPWSEEPGRLQPMGSKSQTWLSNFTFTFHLSCFPQKWNVNLINQESPDQRQWDNPPIQTCQPLKKNDLATINPLFASIISLSHCLLPILVFKLCTDSSLEFLSIC